MDELSTIFSALADPTRRMMLARLAQGEATVGELARPFAISLPAISRHLRVLRNARLVERRIDAQRRLCRLNAEPLMQAAAWVGVYRECWECSFEQLADYLAQDQAHRQHLSSSTTDKSDA